MDGDRKGLSNVTLCGYRPTPLDSSLDKGILNQGFTLDQHPAELPIDSHPPAKHLQQRAAVQVNHVKLSYGRGKNAKPILSQINLNVPEGAM
jgi:hypothetical protein